MHLFRAMAVGFAMSLAVPMAWAGGPERINLARTSLAAVSASSVNGARSLTDNYYGIVRAFDDGEGYIHSNIKYSYWLAESTDDHPQAQVQFSAPVTVQSLVVEGGPVFSAALTNARGEVFYVAKTESVKDFDKPYTDIAKVVFTFLPERKQKDEDRLVRVDEIRVIGFTQSDEKYTVETPRILVAKPAAGEAARKVFEDWRESLKGAKMESQQTEQATVTTFTAEDGTVLLRVTSSRVDGKTTVEGLAIPKPTEEKKNVEAIKEKKADEPDQKATPVDPKGFEPW